MGKFNANKVLIASRQKCVFADFSKYMSVKIFHHSLNPDTDRKKLIGMMK